MLSHVNTRIIGTIMLVLLAALAIFHLLVLTGIVPPIVWGGTATDHSAMITGELISLVMTVVFMVIVAMKAGFLWPSRFRIISTIGIWCIVVVFLLSTIGNLTSSITTEKLIFTPLSIVLVVLALRLGIERHTQ